MTAQLSDTLRYRNHDFSLAGVKGSGLFDPRQHGLEPRMKSTDCRRGFICTYDVSEGRLFLETLCIGLDAAEEQEVMAGGGKPLFGKRPGYGDPRHDGVLYEDLHAPVPYSGGLLVADGFIRELYVHMGFHPAWKYLEVHELLFHEGRLVESFDCSEAMARVRERMSESPLKPGTSASQSEIEQWIEKSFRLDYD